MQWKAFKNELPEEGRMILFGNHRLVQSIMYFSHSLDWKNREMAFKPTTHWAYIDLPEVYKEDS
jgi:hypothetical protein